MECSSHVSDVVAILQFYDLEELFNTGGQVPDTSYVFMVRLICTG